MPGVPFTHLTTVKKKESKDGKKRTIIRSDRYLAHGKIAQESRGAKEREEDRDQEGLGARHRAHLSRHPGRDQDQVSPPFPPQRLAGAARSCARDDRLRGGLARPSETGRSDGNRDHPRPCRSRRGTCQGHGMSGARYRGNLVSASALSRPAPQASFLTDLRSGTGTGPALVRRNCLGEVNLVLEMGGSNTHESRVFWLAGVWNSHERFGWAGTDRQCGRKLGPMITKSSSREQDRPSTCALSA